MRKFEEYEAGYESYRIITSPVLREIRFSVKKWRSGSSVVRMTTHGRSRSQRTRLRRTEESRLHEEVRAALENDIGIQLSDEGLDEEQLLESKARRCQVSRLKSKRSPLHRGFPSQS